MGDYEKSGILFEGVGYAQVKAMIDSVNADISKYRRNLQLQEADARKVATAEDQMAQATKREAEATRQATQAKQGFLGALKQTVSGMFDLKSVVLGMVSAYGAMAIIQTVKGYLEDSVKAAQEFAVANRQLGTEIEGAADSIKGGIGTLKEWQGWIAETGKRMGRFTDTELTKMSERIVELTSQFGFNEAQMKALIERTADLAAQEGIGLADAAEAVARGMAGQLRGMMELGVVMREGQLEAKALEMGLGETYAAMTENEQAAVRLALYLDKSADSAGFAAENTDSLAGAQGRLNREWNEAQIALGTKFIPGLIGATNAMADFLELADRTRALTTVAIKRTLGISPSPEELRAAEEAGLRKSSYPGGAPYDYTRARRWMEPGEIARGGLQPFADKPGAYQTGGTLFQDLAQRDLEVQGDLRAQAEADEEKHGNEMSKLWTSQAESHARMVDSIKKQQADLNLSMKQGQETFELEWGALGEKEVGGQRGEDLEREIGNKVAQGFGSQADQDWWISQREIDAEREKEQAGERLTLQADQAQERLDLNAEQAGVELEAQVEQQGIKLEAMTTGEGGFDAQLEATERGLGKIDSWLENTEYPAQLESWDEHWQDMTQEAKSAWSSLQQWMRDNPIKFYYGGGDGGGGLPIEDVPPPPPPPPKREGPGGQYGLERVVASPTWFHAGEGGQAEVVRVTPVGPSGPQVIDNRVNQTVNMGGVTMGNSGASAYVMGLRLLEGLGNAAYLSGKYGG